MTHCPDDDALQRFIAEALPPAEVEAIGTHLDTCERCRLRLDVLAGVTTVGAVLARAEFEPRAESPSLLLKMEQLAREATSLIDTPSGLHTTGAEPGHLPLLQPSASDGFIGRLGNLDIRRVIGRGGMGVVYEALDPVLYRTVAVKVLSPHLLGDDEAKERFLREARAAAALTHEHVVAIHAIDSHDGVPFLVLQHVDGESLADVLDRETKLPVEEAARIGAQVARGLAAAHAQGLVHRDIKPANLLLERDSRLVRITDFGLVKSAGASITGMGMLAGTPAYMSPEQTHGDEIDARSDLFSLGVVLYEMATGRPPFTGDSPFVILSCIRTDQPKPLTDHDPTLPAWFCSVVDRLLEKDRTQRVQSAAEVAELLERQAPAAPRRKLRPYAVAGFAFAVVAAIIAMVLLTRGPEPSPGPAPVFTRPSEITIAGRGDQFPTLAAAIQVAADGDMLEVHGNGPFPSPKIEIRGKRLTIRAAEGSRPLFQPEAAGVHQWIHSDSDLTLIGLDVEWPGVGKSPEVEPLAEGEFAVVTVRGRTALHRCRFQSGTRNSCVSANGPLTVTECQFVSDRSGGRCLLWWATGQLSVTQSSFEARFGIALLPSLVPIAPQAEIADCTFRTDTALLFVRPAGYPAPVPMAAQRCLFDTERFAMLFYAPMFPTGRRPTANEMRTTLRKVLLWTDRECVYRRKQSYLVGWTIQRPIAAADVTTLADWNALWKPSETKSIEGDFQFHPRPTGSKVAPRLDTIKDANGAIPPLVGATRLPE